MQSGRNIHTSSTSQNPLKDTETADWFIAGGSSGGSAVAVATGSCFG